MSELIRGIFLFALEVLVKKELRKGVTFIKSKVLPHDVIWFKLSKTFFKGWSVNLFLCVAYFGPANSSYTTRTGIDFFVNIEEGKLITIVT